MYSEAYFTECTESSGAHGPAPYMEMVEDTAPQRARAARRMDGLLGRLQGRKGRFFEIGCGPGYFLAEMRDLGWAVGGLEISEFAVREARETQGVDVRRGALIPGSLVPASEDVIFLGDVLEHLPRPLEALREVHAGLVADGLVVIAVPSTLNLLSGRLGLLLYGRLGRVKTLRIPPYHLFEYTPRTLPRMLEAAGFDLLYLRQSTVPLKRMGLRGSALENLAKASLQVLALATSRLFNRGGIACWPWPGEGADPGRSGGVRTG